MVLHQAKGRIHLSLASQQHSQTPWGEAVHLREHRTHIWSAKGCVITEVTKA